MNGYVRDGQPGRLFIEPMSQSSIRNQLRGTVTEIVAGPVVSEVVIETAAGTISAVITTGSVRELNLKIGDAVHALIKATNVSVELSA
jgi:molybdopterin-binding protein